MILTETEPIEHNCLILMICLAVLLIKIYMQNLAETPKLTLFWQGKSSGTFTDPLQFAWSPVNPAGLKLRDACCWDLPSDRRKSWKLLTDWVTACSPVSSAKSREQFIL